MTAIRHAHLLNIAKPGCFTKKAKEMFAANILPDMEFPNDVPSSEIFNLIYKPAETTSQAQATQS
ncbi:hypothetical protein Hamer_G002936 [Homarus americanus]|uniref:Uncharacterized protein n=1 Tax=Homarus americanus TaxID=6706 RepID=A0A8J5JYI8_HOMAM|nr:hypothetical protein Hamer_G002936 [Homarus americanus]